MYALIKYPLDLWAIDLVKVLHRERWVDLDTDVLGECGTTVGNDEINEHRLFLAGLNIRPHVRLLSCSSKLFLGLNLQLCDLDLRLLDAGRRPRRLPISKELTCWITIQKILRTYPFSDGSTGPGTTQNIG